MYVCDSVNVLHILIAIHMWLRTYLLWLILLAQLFFRFFALFAYDDKLSKLVTNYMRNTCCVNYSN